MGIVIMSNFEYSKTRSVPSPRGVVDLVRSLDVVPTDDDGNIDYSDEANPWVDAITGVPWERGEDSPFWGPTENRLNIDDATVDESWSTFYDLTGLDDPAYFPVRRTLEGIGDESLPYLKIHPRGSKGEEDLQVNRAYYKPANTQKEILDGISVFTGPSADPDTLGIYYGDEGVLYDDMVAELSHWLDFTKAGTQVSGEDRGQWIQAHSSFDDEHFAGSQKYGGGLTKEEMLAWGLDELGAPPGGISDYALTMPELIKAHKGAHQTGIQWYDPTAALESRTPDVPVDFCTHSVIEQNLKNLLNKKMQKSERALDVLNILSLGQADVEGRKVPLLDVHDAPIPEFDPTDPDSYNDMYEAIEEWRDLPYVWRNPSGWKNVSHKSQRYNLGEKGKNIRARGWSNELFDGE